MKDIYSDSYELFGVDPVQIHPAYDSLTAMMEATSAVNDALFETINNVRLIGDKDTKSGLIRAGRALDDFRTQISAIMNEMQKTAIKSIKNES